MQMLPALALTLLAAAVPAACGNGRPRPSPPAEATSAVPSPRLTHLLTTQHSAYQTEAEAVLRDSAAWADAWRALHAGVPDSAPPTIDFTRDMVVLVALGERSTGGHDVRVDDVVADGTGAVVRYTATAPGRECMTIQTMTAPVDVVRVPRAAGTVRFERRDATRAC